MKQRLLPRLIVTLMILPPVTWAARKDPEFDALDQQLAALQAHPSNLVESAYYLQSQAKLAMQAVLDAPSRERDAYMAIAKERIDAAALTAKTAALQQSLEPLKATIEQLHLAAKQRELDRTQQALEQLKNQLQTQIQDTERAQQTAQAESIARLDAEQALNQAAGKQQARLQTTRKKTLRLNHEEAELTSGEKLPPSHLTSRGEIFLFDASAFQASGTVSSTASTQIKALAAYLALMPKALIEIIGYDGQAEGGKQLATTIRQALGDAGAHLQRINVSGHANTKQARGVELIVKPN